MVIVSLVREALARYTWEYISSKIADKNVAQDCKTYVDSALKATCHVARAGSVAYAAGFCAYYARMVEKMGVFEVIRENISGKGKALHNLLAHAAQRLFLESKWRDALTKKEMVDQILRESADIVPNTSDRVINDAKIMLEKLLGALSRLHRKNIIGDSLFPIVEQEFLDFDDHIYGTPDLILEDTNNKRAVVVDWKSYKDDSKLNDVDIAQVITYSIIEARRLGITGLEEVETAILGINPTDLSGLSDVSSYYQSLNSQLKIIPTIITASENRYYPPHPIYLDEQDNTHLVTSLKSLQEIIRRVFIAADHLTLQLTNITSLHAGIRHVSWKEIKEALSKYCITNKGYYAFNATPCGILPCGKPVLQREGPCTVCQFAGDDGPCKFYFARENEDFDTLMWRLRYKVFEEKERNLVSYRAIDLLFRDRGTVDVLLKDERKYAKGYRIDLTSGLPQIEVNKSVVFYVNVKRGKVNLGKIRFDIVSVNDIEVNTDEGMLIVRRKLREIEKNEQKYIGVLKRSSVGLYILSSRMPLLNINTFMMIDKIDYDNETFIYYLYTPSPVLYQNFLLFTQYLTHFKKTSHDTKLIMFEADVNLTLMELRGIDVLHRYVGKLSQQLEKETDIPLDEIQKENKIIENQLNKSMGEIYELMQEIPIYRPIYRILVNLLKNNKRDYE
jgi:hypothetical protein